MTPEEIIKSLNTSHLESLLEQLESLSRHGETRDRTLKKKKTIIDYVRFLVAKSTLESIE
jgi:hypothetical protein